ncbi:uncharacterized protein Dwil_GK28231 [Drosophila willistoni]|uniref:Uncharacterized protein n=2 Tax=Drosophila willistoni TaxID=7260 RepID=A0A0Q9WTJ2_DROWI|nr:uncharacterized protein Dwil_GK28231 [Drosophila willistoni]
MENSHSSTPKTVNGFQDESQMRKSSQTCTPKTLQASMRSLQKTIEIFNSQKAKKNSLLNTSWPGSKSKSRMKPLPICVSAKKLGISQMESEINTTQCVLENQNQRPQVLTPKSCQRSWQRFMSGVLNSNSSCGEYLNDISIETTPNTQVALTSTSNNQSTPNPIRKSTPKSKLKCVKGGFVEEYKKMLQEMDIEQRQLNLSLKKPSHIVIVLRTWETVGIKMALVKSETEPDAGPIIFSIIINPDLADRVAAGSRLQLYFNEEPLEMPNKQYLHLESNKVILL